MGPGFHVEDMDRSLAFYIDVLGMKKIGKFGGDKLTEWVLSYGDSFEDDPMLALISLPDHTGPYDLGDGLRKLMIMVDDVAAIVAKVPDSVTKAMVTYETHKKIVAHLVDPDGYHIEIVQCI
ncbi:MAG: VOC family protein [bacterium]|nr:VOC family protein [bacterium]